MPDALVLAGGRPDPVLTGGASPKAFAPLAGRTMVDYVVDALRATPGIARIALVGPIPLPAALAGRVDIAVQASGELLDNVAAGLSALGGDAPILAAAADIPLLTPGAVTAFLDAAAALDADISYAVVPRAEMAGAFPEARKTFVRLREGTFTGGSLFLIRPAAFTLARGHIERAIHARKKPWQLAMLLGPTVLLGMLTGRASIPALERRVTVLVGIRARAVVCRTPEIALDVDHPDTLALVERRIGSRPEFPDMTPAGGMRPT
jgi:GTP:adenosylcobinamide-phosphate guanylyltransferase